MITSLISIIRREKIPKSYNGVVRMRERLIHEEKMYQKKQKMIQEIKSIQEKRRERTRKPDKRSLFQRCFTCNELYLKSGGHTC